jgi:ribosomal protein S18 acetylase RimI-like enzyme
LADARAIAEIRVEAWQSAYRGLIPDDVLDNLSLEDVENRWRERIAEPWGHIFVAETGDRVVGFAGCGRSHDEAEPAGEIYVIYVHPEEWRKGYGLALVSEALERLQEHGFAEAILWVIEGNQQAIGFYKALGFEADGASKITQRSGDLRMPLVRYRRVVR